MDLTHWNLIISNHNAIFVSSTKVNGFQCSFVHTDKRWSREHFCQPLRAQETGAPHWHSAGCWMKPTRQSPSVAWKEPVKNALPLDVGDQPKLIPAHCVGILWNATEIETWFCHILAGPHGLCGLCGHCRNKLWKTDKRNHLDQVQFHGVVG